MRNNFSLIPSLDAFLFCSISVVEDCQFIVEDSALVVAAGELTSLCIADDFDSAILSEDLCSTAALDDSPWFWKSAGACLFTRLDGSSSEAITGNPSVLSAPVSRGIVALLGETSFAAVLGSLSSPGSSLCDCLAAKPEGFSPLDMVDCSPSFLGLVVTELDELRSAASIDAFSLRGDALDGISFLGNSLDSFSFAAASAGPLSLRDSLAFSPDGPPLSENFGSAALNEPK